MARGPDDITDAELAVLRALWRHPAATIRELADQLYPAGGPAHYATVQKLLDRLEGKRFARRDADRVPHRFGATVTEDELVGRSLRSLAAKLCGGSLSPLVSSLVRGGSLSPTDLADLRALVDTAPPKPRRKR